MKLRAVPTNVIELLALALRRAPLPLADTMVAMLLARTLMAATKLGIFEALATAPATPEEVAAATTCDAGATERLLFALAGAGYLRVTGSRYALAPIARQWMLAGSPQSLRDATLHRYLDLRFLESAEEFVRTGRPVDYHAWMSEEEWSVYERGQRSHALFISAEVARKAPVPQGARSLLDIGGGHGLFSEALCHRYPALHAIILDLPGAIAAACSSAADTAGSRLSYREGDARTADLGSEAHDAVFVGNLVHHFDHATNRDLMTRIARSLRPGGWVTVLDVAHATNPRVAGQLGALAGFYFALTSAGGTYTSREIAGWQRDAGLRPRRPIRLLTGPGYVMQCARRAG